MPISESQLETWSHQGSVSQSAATYATIKNAMEASGTSYAAKSFRVFLQGSYGNDTNIYAESDVDVVICQDSSFYHDLEALDQPKREAFNRDMRDGTYPYDNFRRDVEVALRNAFGNSVVAGTKAICINPSGSRRSADVIPAFQYRLYYNYATAQSQDFHQGIAFYTSGGVQIVNYPELHSQNLTTKHQSTGNRLKPLIRVFKNVRSALVEGGELADGNAPSYFIEGLLYNVPDDKFSGNYQQQCANVLNWLLSADRQPFVTANRRYYLLRDNAHNCWPPANCQRFLDAFVARWNR